MIGNFLDYFENPHSYVITALVTFGATFGKKLGHFLLQHLVTLAVANLERSTPLQQLTLESFDNIFVSVFYIFFFAVVYYFC